MPFGLIILQFAALASPPPEPPDATLDPAAPTRARSCPEAKGGEITVCAREADPNRYRLPLPQTASPGGLPRAEWGLGSGVTGGIAGAARNVGGFPSNAVMATIRIPF